MYIANLIIVTKGVNIIWPKNLQTILFSYY